MAYEAPCRDDVSYERRCQGFDSLVDGDSLHPYEWYLDKLDSDENVILFSLSGLKHFIDKQ